ncbi:MAG: ribbon-helix-helix protein, CopG family [Chloroflexota bacterium]|nr:ribbon-helix-helix protein, CopG family [Chloroflexota bacterium]
MKRTTIVLPDDLAALLERERRRRGVSAAAVVREALDTYFGERRRPLAIAALGRSGETTVARDAEEILAREWTYERLMGLEEPAVAPGDRESTAVAECARIVDTESVDRSVDGQRDEEHAPNRSERSRVGDHRGTATNPPIAEQDRPT